MAVHERDNQLSGLLRQSLASDAGAPGNCPGPDLLAAYYERSLGSDELLGCEAHVSHCAHCRERLAILARAEAPPQIQPRHGWLWNWRLLAPGVAALLVLTIWGVRRRSPSIPAGPHTANEPLVAMSRPEQSPATQLSQSPTPTSAPLSGAAGHLHSREELHRAAPQLQASAPDEPGVAQKKLSRDLPVNGRDTVNALKTKPDGPAAAIASQLVEQKALDAQSAAPAAPSPALSSPSAMAQGTARGSVNPASGLPVANSASGAAASSARASESVAAADDAGKNAEVSRAKQMQAGAVSDKFGTTNDNASLRQSPGLQAAQTIIRTPDAKILWRIAGAGFVERSENGGATWRGQLPESNANLTAGSAPGSKVLWLVGENGLILLTKDTAHWKKIPPPISADFAFVEAKNASSATVTSVDGQKFSTSDGGKNWTPVR